MHTYLYTSTYSYTKNCFIIGIYIYHIIQGVSFFHVHISTTYGGMRTTLYGNFVLRRFKFCKKLQRFEFICEKTNIAVKSLFFTKISWKLA